MKQKEKKRKWKWKWKWKTTETSSGRSSNQTDILTCPSTVYLRALDIKFWRIWRILNKSQFTIQWIEESIVNSSWKTGSIANSILFFFFDNGHLS